MTEVPIEKIVKKLDRLEGVTSLESQEEVPDLLDISQLFTKKKELDLAKTLANKYLTDFVIENESDRNILRQLIYLEVFHHTLQKAANDYDKGVGSVPLDALEALHKNITQIVALKEKLGLTRKKNEKEVNDSFLALKTLEKKFKVWESENQGSRHMSCPHCGKMILLKIKMDKWETLKHPFFVDRVLANKHLIRLYKENKISKQDIALILGTSEDYVSRIIEKIKLEDY